MTSSIENLLLKYGKYDVQMIKFKGKSKLIINKPIPVREFINLKCDIVKYKISIYNIIVEVN